MRRIDYSEYQLKRKTWLRMRAALGTEKTVSSRPRDEAERELLIRMDRARWKRWITEGRLVRVGSRHYRWVVKR